MSIHVVNAVPVEDGNLQANNNSGFLKLSKPFEPSEVNHSPQNLSEKHKAYIQYSQTPKKIAKQSMFFIFNIFSQDILASSIYALKNNPSTVNIFLLTLLT